MVNTLFLHMGPGFHAQIERYLYGDEYSSIDFWDQPCSLSFEELVNSACVKVQDIYRTSNQQVTLIAHSFGGVLAEAISKVHPDIIKKIVLINSNADPFECFVNLAEYTSKEKLDLDLIRNFTVPEKMKFVIEVASSPNFKDLYWTSKESQVHWEEVFSRFDFMNTDTFLKVFSDFLTYKEKIKSEKTTWLGVVEVYQSVNDLLLKEDKNSNDWMLRFPNVQIFRNQPGGHYLHIENKKFAELIFHN
ncbi:MAG: alpha/beta fold hydrolase [Pseudobdellovibrio sp.]